MEARAEICGWFKRIEIGPEDVRRGYINMVILPPINILADPSQRMPTPDKLQKDTVRLYHVGTTEDNRPWFRYE
jgi:hypothetical protein